VLRNDTKVDVRPGAEVAQHAGHNRVTNQLHGVVTLDRHQQPNRVVVSDSAIRFTVMARQSWSRSRVLSSRSTARRRLLGSKGFNDTKRKGLSGRGTTEELGPIAAPNGYYWPSYT